MDSLRSYYQQFSSSGNTSSNYTTRNSASAMAEFKKYKGNRPPTFWERKISKTEKRLAELEQQLEDAEEILNDNDKYKTAIDNRDEANDLIPKFKKALKVLEAQKTAAGYRKELEKKGLGEKDKLILEHQLSQALDSVEEHSKQLYKLYGQDLKTLPPDLDKDAFSLDDVKIDRDEKKPLSKEH